MLRGASSRLDAAVYEASGYYAYIFEQAARRGVSTRLLLDGHGGANATTSHRLAGGPVLCRAARIPGGVAHWKMLMADGDRLAVGSGNLIKRDAPRDPGGRLPPDPVRAGPGTREWWALASGVDSLMAMAESTFDDAWRAAADTPFAGRRASSHPTAGSPPRIGIPEPAFAPLTLTVAPARVHLAIGGGSVKALTEELIAGCRRRVDLTVPYLHPDAAPVRELLSAIARAGRSGAAARLLLGSVPQPERIEGLRGLPASVRIMDPVRSTTGHAKGVIGDDQVIIGSANWSAPGLSSNAEAALRIDHPLAARYFAAAFEQDWQAARGLEAGRLATSRPGYAGTEPQRSPSLEP